MPSKRCAGLVPRWISGPQFRNASDDCRHRSTSIAKLLEQLQRAGQDLFRFADQAGDRQLLLDLLDQFTVGDAHDKWNVLAERDALDEPRADPRESDDAQLTQHNGLSEL